MTDRLSYRSKRSVLATTGTDLVRPLAVEGTRHRPRTTIVVGEVIPRRRVTATAIARRPLAVTTTTPAATGLRPVVVLAAVLRTSTRRLLAATRMIRTTLVARLLPVVVGATRMILT